MSTPMNAIDTFYFLKNFNQHSINVNSAKYTLDKINETYGPTELQTKALIKAMCVCHARRFELLANTGATIMFDEDAQNPVENLPAGYIKHLQSIVMHEYVNMIEHTNCSSTEENMLTECCVRYLNDVIRIDIAKGRRRPEIIRPLRKLTWTILQSEYPSKLPEITNKWESIDSCVTAITHQTLAQTAHYMDLSQLTYDWAHYIRNAIKTLHDAGML